MNYGEKARLEILEAGLQIWRKDQSKVNASNIAELIGRTRQSLYYHFRSERKLKNAVAKYGVEKGDSFVIVCLMLSGSEYVENLSQAERSKHLNAVAAMKSGA